MAFGDSPWSLCVNCTDAQILRYLDDRAAKGCNALLFSAIERRWSNQRPTWRNVDGIAPFVRMRPVNWQMQERYWTRVDFVVNQCLARDMVCFMTPAYSGYGNGSDGWIAHYRHASDDMLFAYGAALGRRYQQGNVVWVLGGDDANDLGVEGAYRSDATPVRSRQWQIALGLQSVRPKDLYTAHTGRHGMPGKVNGEAYRAWHDGYRGFNLNNIYGRDGKDDAPTLAAAAWARPGPMPFFLIEAGYEDPDGRNDHGLWPAIQSVLGGALVGFFGGHDAIWHMGSFKPDTGAASVLDRYLVESWKGYARLSQLLKTRPWHTLMPVRDAGFVTSGHGPGEATVCAAITLDGELALVWNPARSIELDLSRLTPAQLRVDWMDPFGEETLTLAHAVPSRGRHRFAVPRPGLIEVRAAER